MGWGDCGTDSAGRPIGYAFRGVCDERGCRERINRGLAHVCGDMHGECAYSCDKYYCDKHLHAAYVQTDEGDGLNICGSCKKLLLEGGEWVEDEEEGILVRVLKE